MPRKTPPAEKKTFRKVVSIVRNFFPHRPIPSIQQVAGSGAVEAPRTEHISAKKILYERQTTARVGEVKDKIIQEGATQPKLDHVHNTSAQEGSLTPQVPLSTQNSRPGQLLPNSGPLSSLGSICSPIAAAEPEQLLKDDILCTLIISHSQKQLDRFEKIPIKWNYAASYHLLDSAAKRSLQKHDKLEQVYRKSGLCRLINDNNGKEFSSNSLERQEEWSGTVAPMVTSFWSQHPTEGFHLEILWEYSGLLITREVGLTYAETIRNIIESKMRNNWEEKKFIPCKDLRAIMSEGTVAELINEDRSLDTPEFMLMNNGHAVDRAQFTVHVTAFASRLLALFVYVDLPLKCLYKLVIQGGVEDIHLPLQGVPCPMHQFIVKWGFLLSTQGGFVAHVFSDIKGKPQHRDFESWRVIPIMFDEKNLIGEGSFGKVFEVLIDSDHHFFSDDKTESFALKCFFDQGSRTEGDFQNEAKMLGLLSKIPHDHITRHLALWTQQGKFYMLFPRAEQNLRTFLNDTNHPTLTKDTVLWLLSQFKGLADGVRHIHNLGPSGLGPAFLDQRLDPDSKRRRTGFHHDLKPENILVFAGNQIASGETLLGRTLRISDFGSARIGLILSASGKQQASYFTSNLSHGDAIYGAPDFALEGNTSRPYDLWSLGCIFLECLMWTFGIHGSRLEEFAAKRLKTPEGKGNQDTAFWYIDSNSKIHLKPAVVDQLKELKSHCKGRGVFEHLVRSIGKLLTIPPSERTTAPTLCNELDAMILQARVDLNENPNHYLQINYTQREVAAPPTTMAEEGRRSIDERSVHAPHGTHLLPKSPHQRSRSGTSPPHGNHNTHPDPASPSTAPGHRKSRKGTNGSLSLDMGKLSPDHTQNIHPASPRARSPSISVSIFEDTTPPAHVNGILSKGAIEPSPPVGWRNEFPFRHDDYPIGLRRSGSRDSRGSLSSATFP